MDDFVQDGKMNSGIAIITPIQEVTKLLMINDQLKDLRDQMEKMFADGDLIPEDSQFGDDS